MKAVLTLVLLAAACSRPSPDAPAGYAAPDGGFQASVPGGWKVDDSPGETRKAAFFGPPSGPGAFTESMRVSLLPPGATPESYRAGRGGLPSPLADAAAGGGKAFSFEIDTEEPDVHGPPRRVSARVVLVPTPKGLYALEHAWTTSAGSPAGREAFEALLKSFRP